MGELFLGQAAPGSPVPDAFPHLFVDVDHSPYDYAGQRAICVLTIVNDFSYNTLGT
jgi:hypothetical protein